MSWLKRGFQHAFAVEPSGPAEPTDTQRPVVDLVCKEVARQRLGTPALMALEMSRPLNFVGANVLHFFQPMISAVVDGKGCSQFASFLERRGSIEYICRRIEHFERESDPSAPTEHGESPTVERAHAKR